MNNAFMQRLQAQQRQGNLSDSAAAILDQSASARLGQTLQVEAPEEALPQIIQSLAETDGKHLFELSENTPQTLGQTFANEVVRRLGQEIGAEGQPKDSTALRHSLGSTMDWMRERFGDETAAAASGMILQSTASGVDEDTLGEGLLNVLKFVDRNFGIAAGDAAMAQFNTGINQELNEYFDNGQAELFFDAAALPDGASATQDINSRFFMQTVMNAEDTTSTDIEEVNGALLEGLKEELDKIAELTDLTAKLEVQFSPTSVDTQTALAAYQATPQVNEPQLTSITI